MLLKHDQLKLQDPSVTDVMNQLKSLAPGSFVRLEKSPDAFLQVARRKNDYFVEYRESATQNLVQAKAPATLEQVIAVFRDYAQQSAVTRPSSHGILEWEEPLSYAEPPQESGLTNYIKNIVIGANLPSNYRLLRGTSAKDYMKARHLSRAFNLLLLLSLVLSCIFMMLVTLRAAFIMDTAPISPALAIAIFLIFLVLFAPIQARLRWAMRNFFTDFRQK